MENKNLNDEIKNNNESAKRMKNIVLEQQKQFDNLVNSYENNLQILTTENKNLKLQLEKTNLKPTTNQQLTNN